MASLTKSLSVQLKRKPNSHTKLPRIDTYSQESQQKNRIGDGQSKSRRDSKPQIANIQANSLYQKRSSQNKQISGSKTIQILSQVKGKQQNKLKGNVSAFKLKPLTQEDFPASHINQIKLGKEIKQKINIQSTAVTDAKTDSGESSKASLHPVVNQIQGLLSDQSKKFMMPVKSYNQSRIGQVSSIWWCVVDSLFISIQKILKIRQIQAPIDRQSKVGQKEKIIRNKTQIQSPTKQQRIKKQTQKQTKKIIGIVQSNTKVSLQMTKAYSSLESQIKKNQQTIIRYYQDPNHISLILQAFFYEKAIMFLLGTIRKWNHHEQQLYIHNMSIDLIPCVIECRKLMMDILLQAVENQQQDNKIRKPKYIARQKKLIQISKFTTMMKNQYQKYLNSLGSPHRYKIFYFPQSLKDHATLSNLQHRWRNFVFDVPLFPYIQQKQSRKQYLLVIQPLNLLYKYNKKQQSLQIDPYAQSFLDNVSTLFDIVIFTSMDKQSSLLNFLGQLNKAQILGILDRHYITYLSAKPIKDINKIGGGYQKNKILVLDQKSNAKYYLGCKHSVLLTDGNHTEVRVARINGKLVKLDDHNEDYLKNLCSRILNCGENGGNWQKIIVDKNLDKLDRKK